MSSSKPKQKSQDQHQINHPIYNNNQRSPQIWLLSLTFIIIICEVNPSMAFSSKYGYFFSSDQDNILSINKFQNNYDTQLQSRTLTEDINIPSPDITKKPIQIPRRTNAATYQLLLSRLKERQGQQKHQIIRIPNFKRMQFPSQKYAKIPTTMVSFNGTSIPMHHEVLQPILPEQGKNWFRRVVSHRYSFVIDQSDKSKKILDDIQIQKYKFLKNMSAGVDFIWNHMLTTASPIQLSKAIYFNWYKTKYSQAQYTYFQLMYNTSKYKDQIPFCIVGTGRNLNSRGLFYQFFRTIAQQNYSNYKVVAIDDNSTDNTMQAIAYSIFKYFPKLIARTVLITNQQNVGAFNNKDFAIKQNCDANDIIIDFDLDDMLISRQVLKTLNALYQQNQQLLIIYTNFLSWDKPRQYLFKSKNNALTSQQFATYRQTLGFWRTSHLKSYKKVLYDLVPLSYLADLTHIREQDGKIYPIYGRYTSDQCMMISMVEIAGLNRIKYIDQLLHLYRRSQEIQASSQCHVKMQEYYQLQNRIRTPLQIWNIGKNNGSVAKPMQGYQPPIQLLTVFKQKQSFVQTKCRDSLLNPFLDKKQMLYKKLALAKKQNITIDDDLGNISEIVGFNIVDVSAVIITTGVRMTLKQALDSFFEKNSYPFDKVIVIWDGIETEYLNTIKNIYNDKITWIITNTTLGQVDCYDLAFRSVSSKYVYISEDNIKYIRKGFIQYSLIHMQNTTEISQVMINRYNGVYNEQINLVDDLRAGFSFRPSVYRLKNYLFIEGGFGNFTRNVSYGKDGYLAQKIISVQYYQHGVRVYGSNITFTTNIFNNGNQLQQWSKFTYDFRQFKKKVTQMNQTLKNICWFVSRSNKADRKRYRVLQSTKDSFRIQYQPKPIDNDKKLQQQVVDILKNQSIQIGSKLFTDKLPQQTMSNNFTDNFTKLFYLQLLELDKIEKKTIPNENIKIQNFNNYSEVDQYLTKLQTSSSKQVNLARQLISNKKPDDRKKILQAQYLYYNQKLSLNEIIEQQSLCIFIEGYDIMRRSNYSRMFQSIQNQNYTNYHVVIVDDNSPTKNTPVKIYQYVKRNYPKLYQKVSFIAKNQQRLYTAGNVRIRANQLCKQNDIVVIVGANSFIIGKQSFKVINALFQNPETWVVLFRAFKRGKTKDSVQVKEVPERPTPYYRTKSNNMQISIKTYRNEMTRLIPIQHLTQFSYNQQIKMYTPHFYKIQSQLSVMYSLLEMSGVLRIILQQDILGYYQPLTNNKQCQKQQDSYTLTKIQTKTPTNALGYFRGMVKYREMYKIPTTKLSQLKKNQMILTQCRDNIIKQQQKKLINQIKNKNINQFLSDTKNLLTYPNHYIDHYLGRPFQHLPFCIAINSTNKNQQDIVKILQSFSVQNYNEITYLIITKDKINDKNKYNFNLSMDIRFIIMNNSSYYTYLQVFKKQCTKNTLIMYVNYPVKNNVIQQVNQIYQKFNTWIIYSEFQNSFQVHAFYIRVFQLIGSNDFSFENRKYLQLGDRELQTLIFLQLCPKHSYKIPITSLYSIQKPTKSQLKKSIYYSLSSSTQKPYKRRPYDMLLKLSQDYKQDIKQNQQNILQVFLGKGYFFKPLPNTQMNKIKLMKSVEYQHALYLPLSHSLNKRQFNQYHWEYGIGNYSNQLPICLTVIGRNNTQNKRHYKNVQSILQQNYTNYHIVYVDDDSDDKTLQQIIQYFKNTNYPPNKIKYIKNKNRKFATYNIINTAFKFCELNDIQVILDGDDQFIGKQVFNLINAVYQKNPQYWVVYTNFKSNNYGYGIGFHRPNENQYIGCDGRVNAHYMTPLRSWRVKFVRSIPLVHHQLEYGGWLDTLYDEALQYVMLQLASPSRFTYIPVITYEYNRNYGSNDDSSTQKILHRFGVLSYVQSLKMVEPLLSIQQNYKNQQIQHILNNDQIKQQYVIKYS